MDVALSSGGIADAKLAEAARVTIPRQHLASLGDRIERVDLAKIACRIATIRRNTLSALAISIACVRVAIIHRVLTAHRSVKVLVSGRVVPIPRRIGITLRFAAKELGDLDDILHPVSNNEDI